MSSHRYFPMYIAHYMCRFMFTNQILKMYLMCHQSILKAQSKSNVMTRTRKRSYGIARKRDEFVHSIDTTKVQEIVQTLTDNNNIDIDQVSFSICSLFDSAGKITFRSRCTECIDESKEVDNPWFNKECRNERKNYRRARGKYRRSKLDRDICQVINHYGRFQNGRREINEEMHY